MFQPSHQQQQQQQRNRAFSNISRASLGGISANSRPTTPSAKSRTGAATLTPRSTRTGSPHVYHRPDVQRFTVPDRPSTPKVLHVFPATARQQVLTTRAASNPRTSSPNAQQRTRTGSPQQQQQQGPRSSSPRSLLLNPHHSSNKQQQLPSSANKSSPARRNNVVSPFRNVHSQPMSQTLDGRLLYLLKDFSSTVMPTQDQKVQNIASRLRRSKILTDKELNALETCHQRNMNFMGTIEKILGEAVEQGVDMRRSVVHQSYEIWRACNDANTYITTLLDTAQSAIGVGKFSRTNVHGTAFNQSQKSITAGSRSGSAFQSPALSRGGSHIRSSSAAGGNQQQQQQQQFKRYNSPSNFGQISKPDAPPRQQLTHFDQQYTRQSSLPQAHHQQQMMIENNNNNNQQQQQNFSQAPTVQGGQQQQNEQPLNHNLAPSNLFIQAPPDLQTTLQQHQYQQQQQQGRRSTSRGGTQHQPQPHTLQVGSVQVEDAREAQMMFEKLFGPEEGRTRFLHWLSELPESTIQQLHRSLTH